MKKPYAFISYSTKDSEEANLVYSYLESKGISCWIASHNIEGGESFSEKIWDAIADCTVFLMIVSGNSDASNHVSNELAIASEVKKKIIPFRLNAVNICKKNRYHLINAQWIDAFPDMNEALKHLLLAIRREIPDEAVEAAPAEMEIPKALVSKKDGEEKDLPDYTRDELVDILLQKIEKFPYCLRDRTYGVRYESFLKLSSVPLPVASTMWTSLWIPFPRDRAWPFRSRVCPAAPKICCCSWLTTKCWSPSARARAIICPSISPPAIMKSAPTPRERPGRR